MVVIDLPFASLIAVTQDRVASPSRWIVHAPHAATPQPNFVPVSPRTSRRYQSTGIVGSPSNDCAWPLTCRVIMLPSLSNSLPVESGRRKSRRPASPARIAFPVTAVRQYYAAIEEGAMVNTMYYSVYSDLLQISNRPSRGIHDD